MRYSARPQSGVLFGPVEKAWLMSWRPARAVGDPEECGADEMKREWEREGTILTKLIPIMFEITSELEKRKGKHPPTDELGDDELAFQCLSWVLGQYIERHGTYLGEESEAIQNWIIGGFDQWVLFFRESGLETAVNENQLSRMFCHVNTHVLVRQDALQEPRTPEQTTRQIALHTPLKLERRALLDVPREPEDLRAGMEQEDALLVVAIYDADTLVRAVGRGLVARRLMAALLAWRTEQLLSALQDVQAKQGRDAEELLRELVRLWGVVHVGTAVASWRQHLPTGKQVAQGSAATRAQAATQTDPEEPHPVQGRHCQTDTQTLQPIQQQHGRQHQLQEMQRMQKQQEMQRLYQQYDALICFISINFVGSENKLSRELLKSKRRYEKEREELAQLRQRPGAGAWLQRPELKQKKRAEKAQKKKKQEERKKLESWMDPEALREIQDLAHDFGGEMTGPTAQKGQILQDDHGQYEDMEANGHRTGDDIAD